MRSTRRWCTTVLWSSLMLLPVPANAQGTLADYQRGAKIRSMLNGYISNVPEHPHWIANTNRFWYRTSVDGGNQFVLVDAEAKQTRPAFDYRKLAVSMSAATHQRYTAGTLPFDEITFVDNERGIRFVVNDTTWECRLADYRCSRGAAVPVPAYRGPRAWAPPRPPDTRPRVSPNGKLEAFIRNYNVYVRPVGTSHATVLSYDGSEGDPYQLRSIAWSPDSRKLAAYRVRPGYHRVIHYVESSPKDQLQPKYLSLTYRKPGDVVDLQQPVLFDVATKRQLIIDNTLFPNPYRLSRLEWRHDGHAFTFEYNQRGHQVYRVIEVDATTGKARAVIEEKCPTFFDYSGKKFRYDIDDGKEIIWMSERDGWNHLYLYDGVTGKVKNQITKGHWVVRGVDWVDTTQHQIWFRASGMNPEQDPYFVQYYRINFDGTGLTAFTNANGNHTVTFSPDRAYYVDTWSRVDLPPISELRRTSDQAVVMQLGHANDRALHDAGWRPPEIFVAKGRDGTTDIWGIIVRPTNFDPSHTYHVIESIYAGPHDSFVPKSFSTADSSLQKIGQMQALAELGFIVVQIDGMGTSNRSKAFQDVAWKNLKDAGFPDRILWHKAAAKKYPSYDISDVGIYGLSAGGQNALAALLFHPEFYKVAVSASGCQDNRMDKIWWNEQFMGWPIGPQYAASSNVVNAYRLQGKLLLTVGELDTNVDPSSTMQVVNALIKANKTFDLLVVPGMDHSWGGAYGERKRFDFFVHNLLGVEPPDWNSTSAAAPASAGAR